MSDYLESKDVRLFAQKLLRGQVFRGVDMEDIYRIATKITEQPVDTEPDDIKITQPQAVEWLRRTRALGDTLDEMIQAAKKLYFGDLNHLRSNDD